MAAGTADLIISKGETYRKTFQKQTKARVDIDLTGYTARMQVRETFSSTTTILDLTTENGGLTITPLEGKVSIFVTDTVTSAITQLRGVYDLELIDSSGYVEKFVRGSVKFPEEVTR